MTTFANPFTPTIQSATIKQSPQDFIVQEQLAIDFSEQGEHLWLHLEKTNLNTAFVAKLLAKWANIPAHDVSYSGLKDRHAVTMQWFSVRLPKKIAPSDEPNVKSFTDFVKTWLNDGEKITLLAEHWHSKKLNRGTHKFNRFIITLREVVGEKSAINAQLEQIKANGIPNYFGEQRFGHDDNNVKTALEFFATGRIDGRKPHPKFDRDTISLYLSAARSAIFNAILAQRVTDGSWQTPLTGEVYNLAGSNSVFVADADDTIVERLARHDIHLTGAMWGDSELKSTGDVGQLERQVIENDTILKNLATGLIKHGLKHQRRPLRLLPQDLRWEWLDDATLQLSFTLPAGSFATTLIATLLAEPSPPTMLNAMSVL